MSEREDRKLNQDAELAQLRSMVGDIEDETFSLDDILAEYAKPKPAIAEAQDDQIRTNVLLFPGTVSEPDEAQPAVEPAAQPDEPDDPSPVPDQDPDPECTQEDQEDNLLTFPEKRRSLAGLLNSLSQKADQYAEGMFSGEEELRDPELRRMEQLIPGVDREETTRRGRRRPYRPPAEPDTPPQDLAKQYAKGLKSLHLRIWLVFLLFLPSLYLTLESILPLPPIPNPLVPGTVLFTPTLKAWSGGALLLCATTLSWDVLTTAALRAIRRRPGMDSVVLAACIFTVLDCLTMPLLLSRDESPCFALNILALFLSLQGEHHRRRGLRLSCRTAAASAEPYLVTLDEGKWNGRDTYTKHVGLPTGFGSQIQSDDGAQRIFRPISVVLLTGCVVLSVLSCLGAGQPQRLLWALSCTFTASCAFSAPLIFNRPFHKLARRLSQCGGALAGWPGIAVSRRGDGLLLTDHDLFPPGSVSLNGIKIFGEWSTERVVSYTATLIRESGSGLNKLFGDLLRTQNALYRTADRLCCYEGGGLSANIRGDQVLVGSAAFMSLMDVPLPQGLNVKNAVFCAIDGELAGIFALNYSLPDVVFPSVEALLQEKLSPVLATRDFNIIPAMLRQRFKLAADRMDFPPVSRRRELSDPDQPHSSIITAVLCREGLLPFAETVVGARRLRLAVRVNAVMACVGSVLGMLLACYLTAVGAFASISPVNLLIYLTLWLIPSWLITGWVDQY